MYLGLGSNLGDREGNIARAVGLIHEKVGTVLRQSSLVETEPWGFKSRNKFLNAVILCETDKTPREVLQVTQAIERELGKRKAHATRRHPVHNASTDVPCATYKDRPIDIDILLYDDWHVDEPDLKIPHPLMCERDFVMRPLQEIKEDLPPHPAPSPHESSHTH